MNIDENNTETLYRIVVNHEDQYSILPADREPPVGWRTEGAPGTRQQCLAYIGSVWTDMRPRSLRESMDHRVMAAGERGGSVLAKSKDE